MLERLSGLLADHRVPVGEGEASAVLVLAGTPGGDQALARTVRGSRGAVRSTPHEVAVPAPADFLVTQVLVPFMVLSIASVQISSEPSVALT